MAKKKIVSEVEVKEEVKEEIKQEAPVVAAIKEKNLGAEQNLSGAPKNFIIRCPKCCWSRVSSGLSVDLTDINEIKPNCKTCGKWRKFQCPKCGTHAMMKRIRGNT